MQLARSAVGAGASARAAGFEIDGAAGAGAGAFGAAFAAAGAGAFVASPPRGAASADPCGESSAPAQARTSTAHARDIRISRFARRQPRSRRRSRRGGLQLVRYGKARPRTLFVSLGVAPREYRTMFTTANS